MFTAQIQLETLFEFNRDKRIISTREPSPSPAPGFALIRTATDCAWAVRADVPINVAEQLVLLAQEERPVSDLRAAPLNADRYLSLLPGIVTSGPAFTFPESIPEFSDVAAVEDVRLLQSSVSGWPDDELPGRSPVMAVIRSGQVISVCFCARRSHAAAEAGVETQAAFRGQGLALRVTAAWAQAVRNSGRLAIYSTSWSNKSSLAVARKLGLNACASASDWSIEALHPASLISQTDDRRESALFGATSWARAGQAEHRRASLSHCRIRQLQTPQDPPVTRKGPFPPQR